MKTLRHLFDKNRAWAADLLAEDTNYFEDLAQQQCPELFWIGCSDSRVPANQIVGLAPGEVFVHRNIANQVIHSDMNCMSALEYAVEVLKVKHIVVCGHYGCGGVEAAMQDGRRALADNWIGQIRETRRAYHDALDQLGDRKRQLDRLCELNTI